MSNCTQCHELGKKVSKAKCITCHTEISDLIMKNKGFHSQKDVISKECWDCHGEHYGRNFQIVRFDKEEFDHSKSGFELVLSHSKLKCDDCHNIKNIINEKLKKRKNTFLGLTTDCKNCHEDFHQGTLDENCSNCHTEEKFIPAEKFSHANTKFKITGAHEKVDCINCHPKIRNDSKAFQKFADVKFKSCNNCHEDVHKTKFGNDCKSCHSTVSFHNVNITNGFNHSRTNFPLIGKHNKAKCENCHKGGLTSKPKFTKCYDCHEDYHKGEFVKNSIQTDCKDCHNEKGFSPSLFTIEKHATTNFELTNAHAATPCNACHLKESSWKFNITSEKCINCHDNIHGNNISDKYFDESKCESCHSTLSWKSIEFDHKTTKFELLGKHQSVSCSDCHLKYESEVLVEQRFSSLNSNCTQCHFDVHFGQFIEDKKELCSNCHTFNNWQPELFEHSNTRFKLDGAHSKLNCEQCHKLFWEGEKQFTNYKIEETTCKSCHS